MQSASTMNAPRSQVLIVGAGPVGLVASVALLEQGISVRIVDEQTADGKRTYPVLLHPRTLRTLASLGVTAPLEWRGHAVSRLVVYADHQRRAVLQLPSAAEFSSGLLTLPQDVLRQALMRRLEELGARVEWQTRLVALKQEPERVRASIVRRQRVESSSQELKPEWMDVASETVEVEYLIGADGVHSAVREELGIGWTAMGPPRTYAFFDAPDPRAGDEGQLVLSEGAGNSVYPLQSAVSRFTFEIGVEMPHAPGLAQLRQLLESRVPWYAVNAERFEWSGSAVFNTALAERFGEHRVWLAGDAAHCTGPLGGQSLNVGISEAQDLARRIAEKRLRPSFPLAASYSEQRLWQWQQLFGLGPSRPKVSGAPEWVKRHVMTLLPGLPASGDDLDDLLEQLHVRAA
jgi:2-polyprenyl-6-methoxyphenol hydroxylase-like FAD-dependent oxidoreductase